MSDTKRTLFLMDKDFNGHNTINAAIAAWCKENYLHLLDINQVKYLDIVGSLVDSIPYEKYAVYRVHVDKTLSGFNVYIDFNDYIYIAVRGGVKYANC